MSIFDFPDEFLDLPFENTNPKDKSLITTFSFMGKNIKFWRLLLLPPNNIKSLKQLKKTNIIFLCHGGDFAACVFKEGAPTIHKTFSKYITRKKQGKRQSNKDKESHPKSAGAFLRRRNEDIFNEQVQTFVKDWKAHIEEATLIFIFAPVFFFIN